MINVIGSRVVLTSQIKISEQIASTVRKTLFGRPPLLQDARDLTDEAIIMATLLSPPIVYEKKSLVDKRLYICIANFRSLQLAGLLPGSSKIRVNLIEPPFHSNIDSVALMLNMISDLALSLDPDKAGPYFLELRNHAIDYSPDVLSSISTKCRFKKSFLEAIGINRKKY
jgi:hypothetical protein